MLGLIDVDVSNRVSRLTDVAVDSFWYSLELAERRRCYYDRILQYNSPSKPPLFSSTASTNNALVPLRHAHSVSKAHLHALVHDMRHSNQYQVNLESSNI